jgi:hypothetical protein
MVKTMQQQIFKPRYPTKVYLGLVFSIPMEAFLLWQLLADKDTSPENIFGAGFFGLMLALMPYTFVKRIVFDANAFSIEKYLWPTKTIEYTDVIDIGTTVLKTRSGRIAIQSMTNADELRKILTVLIEQGKISRYQIENKVVAQEIISRKALIPTVVISFVLWSITLFVWPYEESLFRDLSFLVFFVPIYFMVYQFLKNRAENQ